MVSATTKVPFDWDCYVVGRALLQTTKIDRGNCLPCPLKFLFPELIYLLLQTNRELLSWQNSLPTARILPSEVQPPTEVAPNDQKLKDHIELLQILSRGS